MSDFTVEPIPKYLGHLRDWDAPTFTAATPYAKWDASTGRMKGVALDLSGYATLDALAMEEQARVSTDTQLNAALAGKSPLGHGHNSIGNGGGSVSVGSDGVTTLPEGDHDGLVIQSRSGFYPFTIKNGSTNVFQIAPLEGSVNSLGGFLTTAGFRLTSFGSYLGVRDGNRLVVDGDGIKARGSGPSITPLHIVGAPGQSAPLLSLRNSSDAEVGKWTAGGTLLTDRIHSLNNGIQLSLDEGTGKLGVTAPGGISLNGAPLSASSISLAGSSVDVYGGGIVSVNAGVFQIRNGFSGSGVALQRGPGTQTGYVEWFNPSNQRMAYMGYDLTDLTLAVEAARRFTVSGSTWMVPTGSDRVPLTICLAPDQSANAFEVRDASDVLRASVAPSGAANFGGRVVANGVALNDNALRFRDESDNNWRMQFGFGFVGTGALEYRAYDHAFGTSDRAFGLHISRNNADVHVPVKVNGDITARRNSSQGAYYFGDNPSNYLYFNGSSYSFGTDGATISQAGDVAGSTATFAYLLLNNKLSLGAVGTMGYLGYNGVSYGLGMFPTGNISLQDSGSLPTDLGSVLAVTSTTTTKAALALKAAPGQSAPLLSLRNSSDSELGSWSASGNVTAQSVVVGPNSVGKHLYWYNDSDGGWRMGISSAAGNPLEVYSATGIRLASSVSVTGTFAMQGALNISNLNAHTGDFEALRFSNDAAQNYRHSIFLHVDGSVPGENYLDLAVCNATVDGNSRPLRLRGDNRVLQGLPSSAIADAGLANSQMSAWLDEAGSALKFRCRLSDGTYKTALIPLEASP